MKKVFAGILTAALVLSIGTTSAFMANSEPEETSSTNVDRAIACNYTDTDGDGICDNRDTTSGTNCNGTGKNFVDADGDGICDNRGTASGTNCNSTGKNFVDADGDGICDNYTSGTCQRKGSGQGNSFQGGRNQ